MLIDVHAHMDFLPEEKLIKTEKNKRIRLVLSNSVNLESCKKNLEISKKFSKIKLVAGLYPEDDLDLKKYEEFEEFVLKNKKNVIAIGEIGIDKTEKLEFELQKKVFIKQLTLAKKLKIPVIIHSRKSELEALDILEDYKNKLKIVLHCFSGNFSLIRKGIEIGCFFSIPTNVVRSEHFQKMVREVPKEKILTETDSPHLSPFKEEENEPSFISESIKKMAEIWSVSEDKVEKQIEKNFKECFGF
ncbi:MAG: TatD family hydrolase [Nanoarchaeota archaeon]|nr:TatD family hydrolase [Nanoarchaeota archaeon]